MAKNNILAPIEAKSFQIDIDARKKMEKQYAYLLEDKKDPGRTSADFYYDTKVDENSILVVGLGTGVRGSMQYILNELNHNDRYANFKIYVRTKYDHTDETVKQYIEQNHWTRTTTVPAGYTRRQHTCKYLITESYFPYQWIKKPGQVLIDIWHGTPLKCLGLLKNGPKSHKNSIQQKNFLYTDYFLYPNDYTRTVMHDSYKISTLMPGQALMLGYPRTAGLLKVTEERKKEILAQIAPNGEKVYAYMPTFRGYLTDEETVAREAVFLEYVDSQLRDDQILYVNLHHHVSAGLDYSGFTHIKQFPALIDSYELLTVTECLISDYSSVFFDYEILGKQIILYIEDYDTYLEHQGLNMDIRDLPFDLAQTKEQVVEMLNRGKDYDDTEFRASMCAYDSALNPEKLCQLFAGDETGLTIKPEPKNAKKKVLLYSDGCKDGKRTEKLREFALNSASDAYEFWIGCDKTVTNKYLDSAYPLLHEAPMIGSEKGEILSSYGKEIKKKYLCGEIYFDTAMEFLAHDYALLPIQFYGYTQFDLMVIYDSVDAETIMGLALSNAKKKALVLNGPQITKILKGDTFFEDAVRFASEYCNLIAVTSEKYIEAAENFLPARWKGHISVLGDAAGIEQIIENSIQED